MSKLGTFSNTSIQWHKYLGSAMIKTNSSRTSTEELPK